MTDVSPTRATAQPSVMRASFPVLSLNVDDLERKIKKEGVQRNAVAQMNA
jgi:hypothetical protein